MFHNNETSKIKGCFEFNTIFYDMNDFDRVYGRF